MRKLFTALCLAAVTAIPVVTSAGPINIVVVVDESGSMSGEHLWLDTMVASLDSKLALLGYSATYGLIGFGGGGAQNLGHTLLTAGSAAQFQTATNSLVTSGSQEDGYAGLDYAFNNYAFTAGPRNFILVTDEDRDSANNLLSSSSIAAALSAQNALLNAVLNNPFTCAGTGVLGRQASTGNGFAPDGLGGYTTCGPASIGNGVGTTEDDYVPLAAAAWNLNLLRAGRIGRVLHKGVRRHQGTGNPGTGSGS